MSFCRSRTKITISNTVGMAWEMALVWGVRTLGIPVRIVESMLKTLSQKGGNNATESDKRE